MLLIKSVLRRCIFYTFHSVMACHVKSCIYRPLGEETNILVFLAGLLLVKEYATYVKLHTGYEI